MELRKTTASATSPSCIVSAAQLCWVSPCRQTDAVGGRPLPRGGRWSGLLPAVAAAAFSEGCCSCKSKHAQGMSHSAEDEEDDGSGSGAGRCAEMKVRAEGPFSTHEAGQCWKQRVARNGSGQERLV